MISDTTVWNNSYKHGLKKIMIATRNWTNNEDNEVPEQNGVLELI